MGENERLAKVEAAINSIDKGLERLENKLDNLLDSIEKRFLLRSEYMENVKRLESRIDTQEEEIQELRSKSGKIPPLAAALITLLITVVGWLITIHFGR